MIKMNPYLNFDGTAEEAFRFYESVFGTQINAIHKIGEAPGCENLPEDEKRRVMHIPSAGHVLKIGNNIHLSLHPASREEAERLFNGLSEGGTVEMPLQDVFWGAYYGNFQDKYGINWMINYDTSSEAAG
jgi:PhnB protein